MNCTQAKKVYLSDNPLQEILSLFPKAMSHISYLVHGLVQGDEKDKFNQLVHDAVGDKLHENTKFFISHRASAEKDQLSHDLQEIIGDETSRRLVEKHFSSQVGEPIHLTLICCDACSAANKPMCLHELMDVQRAAVQIEMEMA
jgi:hypothetical protein